MVFKMCTSYSVLFLLACNCSVAGTKNATLPGVLHLDCLRDENTAPPYPGMVSTDQQTRIDLWNKMDLICRTLS